MASFTRYKLDKSTETGFQFEYFCDRCNGAYTTAFQPYPMGVAKQILQSASELIGKKLNWAAKNFDVIEKTKAWDEAQKKALSEAKGHFRHCRKCDRWVCWNDCWDAKAQQCKGCVEKAQKRNGAAREAAVSHCWNCNMPQYGGKFCADCGKPALIIAYCPQCGKKLPDERSMKFCPFCGDTVSSA